MSRINQDLLDRLAMKLGLGKSRVYAKIQEVSALNRLDRNLAALLLAWENGISIQKYSTAEEREQIRGAAPASAPAQQAPNSATTPRSNKVVRSKTSAKSRSKPKDNSVFVVHGRNERLRKSFFAFLRALGLKPMEWSHAVANAKGVNPYIGDILDSAMDKVQAVVVLLSPDDEVKLKDEFCGRDEKNTEGKLQGQARPNVLFEAGLALGRHPHKTLLVEVGKVKAFSDIAGKHMLRLTNNTDKRNEVASRLEKIGCKIDRKGNDWISEGDFSI